MQNFSFKHFFLCGTKNSKDIIQLYINIVAYDMKTYCMLWVQIVRQVREQRSEGAALHTASQLGVARRAPEPATDRPLCSNLCLLTITYVYL